MVRRVRARARGFTILETLAGVFVLVLVAVFSSRMLGLTLRASAEVRDRTLGLELCQRKVREIVEWSRARSGGGLNFNGEWPDGREGRPSQAPFAPAPDAENGRFVVQAVSGAQPIDSPASGLRGVTLGHSARTVRVTASWGTESERSVSLVALVTEPPRRLEEIRVDGAPSSALAPGQQITLRAEGFDAAEAIPDLVYRWDVLPLSGNATLLPQSADGSVVTLVNAVPCTDRTRRCTGGRCRVRVRAMCDGRVFTRTLDIDLGAPSSAVP